MQSMTRFLKEWMWELVVLSVLLVDAVVTLLGTAYGLSLAHWLRPFSLDIEWHVAAIWSAMVIFAAGAVAETAMRRAHSQYWLAVLTGLFLLMTLDELMSFHERLEGWTGIDWQRLYLPVFLVSGLAWLRGVRWQGWPSTLRVLFIAGGVAWALAQVLEFIQWDGNVQRSFYMYAMIPEEGLEMLGSSFFLFAILGLVISMDSKHSSDVVSEPVHSI